MARFFGEVGYGDSLEQPSDSGVWVDLITEVQYYGDVIRNTRKLESGESLNDDISVSNSISIVADDYANAHFFKIKYVRWSGFCGLSQVWKSRAPPRPAPRSVYNGPTP